MSIRDKVGIENKSRVVINISGEIFETYEGTLRRFPETLLGNIDRRMLYYCPERNQYTFYKSRICFEAILYFYQSNGTLNCPMGMPISVFEAECEYFNLPPKVIRKMTIREGIIIYPIPVDVSRKPRAIIHNILENPETSCIAWTFGLFSLSVTWLSVITASLETIMDYHVDERLLRNDPWCVIEISTNMWFWIELALRFFFTKYKKEFFKKIMNWIDFFAVVPFFIILGLDGHKSVFLGLCKTLRFTRVLRLFRLSKHSRRFKVVGIILKSSFRHIQLLMLCLLMVVMIGGTFMFYIETHYDEDSNFSSIPQAIWWAVQTISSVGYGDIVPVTNLGKGLACCFMLFGFVTISLPTLTVVSQLTTLYPKNVEYHALPATF